jgi:Flp pilus assembly protein TadG
MYPLFAAPHSYHSPLGRPLGIRERAKPLVLPKGVFPGKFGKFADGFLMAPTVRSILMEPVQRIQADKRRSLRSGAPVSRRRRRSGGNAILEAVFTLLPTFAIVLAFVDFGLMIFRWSTLQNAVREGVRYAVTFQTITGDGQDLSIETTVQNNALGFVTTTDNPQTIYVKYFNPTTLAQVTTGGNIPGNVVQVSVQGVSYSWISTLSGSYGGSVPFYRSSTPLTLNVYSSDILGGLPAGVASVQE